jgi:hypothetical protein
MDMRPIDNNHHRGVLLPRIPLRNSTDRSAIPSPDDFLLVFSPYKDSMESGLNYWYANHWHRVLSETELYTHISEQNITQTVLSARLMEMEKTLHVTDSRNSNPYKLPLNNVVFDSQNAYNQTKYEYVIPETGTYEIVCDVACFIDRDPKDKRDVSVETFIQVNNKMMINDLISGASTIMTGSVIHITELHKNDIVYGAVGVGNWKESKFRVTSASLTIVKY